MRNLKLLDFNYLQHELIKGDPIFCVDTDSGNVIITNENRVINVDRGLWNKVCFIVCMIVLLSPFIFPLVIYFWYTCYDFIFLFFLECASGLEVGKLDEETDLYR